MNIIYCVSELKDWIKVAKYFEKNKNWNPVLWSTTHKNHQYVEEAFPLTKHINFYDLNRGKVKYDSSRKKISLDEKILSKYLKYEKISLKMMDRMDYNRYSFNYSERVQLYYNILEFILNSFNEYKPKKIIFGESPHSIYHYLIYAVAIESNIKILRLSPTYIYGYTFLTSSIEDIPLYIQKEYDKAKKLETIDLKVEKYFKKTNDKYIKGKPYYMDEIIKNNQKSNTYKILKSLTKSIRYFINNKPRYNDYKMRDYSIMDTFSNQQLAKGILNGTLFKINLEKEYNKYVIKTLDNFNLNDKFIYFPLHYQPERTTSPEGNFFSDQYLAINMLSQASNGKFKIYIKEHLSQFFQKYEGEQGRTSDFYQQLSLLDNIVFIDKNVESFDLIDHSLSVATITGTAGFESVIRGKPAIVFGYPWYLNCEGVFQVTTNEMLLKAIHIIIDNPKLNSLNIKYFLQSIFNISNIIYLNPSNRDSVEGNYNNAESIIRLIENYELQI